MGRLRAAAVWIWENFEKFLAIGGLLVSAGFLPGLLSLTKKATPFEYGIAALGGAVSFSLARALWIRGRLWAIDAQARERLTSDSSPFDPMARVYQDQRLLLKDLVPSGRRKIYGKKFINCEIIGPGSVILNLRSSDARPWPEFRNNTFHDVDMIQIKDGANSNNAIYFWDCDFDGCNFYQMNLLFYRRGVNNWNWITPEVAVSNVPTAPKSAIEAPKPDAV